MFLIIITFNFVSNIYFFFKLKKKYTSHINLYVHLFLQHFKFIKNRWKIFKIYKTVENNISINQISWQNDTRTYPHRAQEGITKFEAKSNYKQTYSSHWNSRVRGHTFHFVSKRRVIRIVSVYISFKYIDFNFSLRYFAISMQRFDSNVLIPRVEVTMGGYWTGGEDEDFFEDCNWRKLVEIRAHSWQPSPPAISATFHRTHVARNANFPATIARNSTLAQGKRRCASPLDQGGTCSRAPVS